MTLDKKRKEAILRVLKDYTSFGDYTCIDILREITTIFSGTLCGTCKGKGYIDTDECRACDTIGYFGDE